MICVKQLCYTSPCPFRAAGPGTDLSFGLNLRPGCISIPRHFLSKVHSSHTDPYSFSPLEPLLRRSALIPLGRQHGIPMAWSSLRSLRWQQGWQQARPGLGLLEHAEKLPGSPCRCLAQIKKPPLGCFETSAMPLNSPTCSFPVISYTQEVSAWSSALKPHCSKSAVLIMMQELSCHILHLGQMQTWKYLRVEQVLSEDVTSCLEKQRIQEKMLLQGFCSLLLTRGLAKYWSWHLKQKGFALIFYGRKG